MNIQRVLVTTLMITAPLHSMQTNTLRKRHHNKVSPLTTLAVAAALTVRATDATSITSGIADTTTNVRYAHTHYPQPQWIQKSQNMPLNLIPQTCTNDRPDDISYAHWTQLDSDIPRVKICMSTKAWQARKEYATPIHAISIPNQRANLSTHNAQQMNGPAPQTIRTDCEHAEKSCCKDYNALKADQRNAQECAFCIAYGCAVCCAFLNKIESYANKRARCIDREIK